MGISCLAPEIAAEDLWFSMWQTPLKWPLIYRGVDNSLIIIHIIWVVWVIWVKWIKANKLPQLIKLLLVLTRWRRRILFAFSKVCKST